ncbi:hypothetical protein N781_16960 [Pontibacillus halophilus JSM 076056 = DSM 19796]|uniref:Exosporium protein C n=1 Tax=Pontibacillus halophilus JSM 076056 = DSM 19796 TaxID=1385510 RepID=A0A0A5GMH0_9BACI|nr:hypothetical protein [Pontibacillus halophilus]KGX92423.1 hypothetical protein N781_16960 [Pontibacillus halophilus JSM 076056 = DSM 19796]
MTKLVDARTSQNASFVNSIFEPVLIFDEETVGQVGLAVGTAGPNLRVQLSGTVTVQLPLAPVLTTITIRVVRGTVETDQLVFSTSQTLDLAITGPQSISFVGSDFNPPIPGSGPLAYTAFISASAIGTARVGPESFNAVAFSD